MRVDLGFVALTDAAPLIVARERGFFEAESVRVTLHREVSWATLRDKVAAGLYQGAQMLAPAALALHLGAGSEASALDVPLSLNVHGAAVGVSQALAAEMNSFESDALARVARARRQAGKPALSFAVVFAFSMHNYMLRHWLAEGGVDPDEDVRIVVAPPTAIAARLRSGEIDGFCVGAPWGAVCEAESGARIVLEAADFWPGGPDKVLALSSAWTARAPEDARAVTRAVLSAALWADDHPQHLATLLAQPEFVGAAPALIARKLGGGERDIRFARAHAAYPWPSHARWIATQMARWGQVGPQTDFARAAGAYRPDLYASAAKDLAVTLPPQSGVHRGASRGSTPDRAHGESFDAAAILQDAAAYPIKRLQI